MKSTAVRHDIQFFLMFGLLFLVSACHHPDLPLLEGTFVFPDGQEALFKDGTFVANALIGTGDYSVQGDHVVLHLRNGKRLEGERVDAEHIRFTQTDGKNIPPFDLYRAGSPRADEGKRALAARTGHIVQTDAEHDAQVAKQQAAVDASAFTPDPAVPMSQYTPIETHAELEPVIAAFTTTSLTDEQLLGAMVPGYINETDAFKRHDIATRELPGLREKVAQAGKQHYYSFRVVPDPVDYTRPFVAVLLSDYSFDHKAFGLWTGNTGCFPQIEETFFQVEKALFACELPVPDEALARRIEALRIKAGDTRVEGRIYAAITRASPRSRPGVVITHAHLVLTSPVDPSLHVEADL